MNNNRLVNCIVKAIASGVICWLAFAFGTFIVAREKVAFLETLGQGRTIAFGVMMAVVSFFSYWMRSKKS